MFKKIHNWLSNFANITAEGLSAAKAEIPNKKEFDSLPETN